MSVPESNPRDSKLRGIFATTHWSVIAAAAQPEGSSAREALAQLCQTYWYPVYAHLRTRGYQPADAQDLTQDLFLRLLQKDFLSHLDPHKGRFRSYLLSALNHLIADEMDRRNSQRRGGREPHVSFDAAEAEDRFRLDPVDSDTPDRLFDRRWALALLERVLDRLRAAQVTAGRAATFEALRPFLVEGSGGVTYASVAAQLGQTVNAVAQAVSRLRRQYRRLFWEEISHTVTSEAEAQEEFRYLCSVMGD